MSGKNIPDNKTRTKSALVSLSEEIENVADKVSKSVVSVRSRTRGNGSGIVWSSDKGVSSHLLLEKPLDPVSRTNGQSEQT